MFNRARLWPQFNRARPRPLFIRVRPRFAIPLRTAAATLGLAAAIVLVAPAAPAVAAAVDPAAFQQVTLAKGVAVTGEPMGLAVLPDRSVVHTARDGSLFYTTSGGVTTLAGKLTVYSHDEEGMQGVAVDPGYASNRFIYLYYAPPLSTPAGDAPSDGTDFSAWAGYNQLSRFHMNANNTLDLASEVNILQVTTSRGICCHVGGDLDFDNAGNLYMTTGDDTNPFASDAYAPIDERTNRNPAYDAQRSASNSNDLRGKLLRIHLNANGTYTIPAGNLFPPGTPKTRPEIYAMGFRNPFRMSVDRASGVVYLGDYGPDAASANASRGPGGQVEFNRITSAGFYGWPYCTGDNTVAETYNRYDFGTATSGAKFDCQNGPQNTSPHNTGITQLPAPRPAWIKYGDLGGRAEMGAGGSESPMGGPIYHYDAANPSTTKFPASLDGHVFLGEFGRAYIKEATVNANGTAGEINAFPWHGTQVMDMAFGPDGSLYVLDYGTGYFNGDANSAVYRIDFIGSGTNRAPTAVTTVDKNSGVTPLVTHFTAAGSSDPDGDALTYSWAFGDGGTATGPTAAHTYATNGRYTAVLTANDGHGNTGTASTIVTVGNTAPAVTLEVPVEGQLFSFGDAIPFRVNVVDPEDASIDCSRVTVSYILGHDQHGHPISSATGCSGTIQTSIDGEHDAEENIFGVFDAQYTDAGANGQPALTTHSQHILQPRARQAEHFKNSSGIQVVTHAGAEGGSTVGYIDNGDWIEFDPYTVANATTFTARIASAGTGGTLTVRSGSTTGPVLATVPVPVTGGWETYQSVSASVGNRPFGAGSIYLVFTGGAGALFDVDEFTFATAGAAPAPSTVQAESYSSMSGIQSTFHNGAQGNRTVGFIENGDWIGFAGVSTANATGFTVRVSSQGAGGTIQVRSGSSTGALLGSVPVSPTGDWETFATGSTALTGGGGPLFLTFAGGAGSLFDVDSFQLYTAGAATPVLLSQGHPSTSSSNENATLVPANAVDGVTTSRWSSGFSDPQWIQVDLGSVRTINRVLLSWEVAYGSGYQLQTSVDGTTWSPVYTTTTGDGGTDDLGVAGSGRYVRMYGTTRATAWGYSLYEFQVYGN